MNFLVLFPLLVVGSLATNYCDKEICKKWNGAYYEYVPHIACRNNRQMASICSKDAQSFDGAQYQKEILTTINSLRNQFASGRAGFPPALRMAELSWDFELADLALLNVKQCESKHDECHNTDAFKFSGQNLAWSASTGDLDVKQAIINGIQSWYDEKKDCTQDVLTKYYQKGGPITGHFTAIVCDRQTKVGCAYATYTTQGIWKNFLLACNFASTNMFGSPIVKSSRAPGSGCSRKSATYPSLCDSSEPIDANKFD